MLEIIKAILIWVHKIISITSNKIVIYQRHSWNIWKITHHLIGKIRMNLFAEQVPPKLKKVLKMSKTTWSLNLLCYGVELLRPRLCFTDEMNNFYVLIEVLKCRQIWVRSSRCGIVQKRKSLWWLASRPIWVVLI